MHSLSLAGKTLFPDGAFAPATILIADSRIVADRRGVDPRADIVTKGWIVPGFIDLQINGAFGFDFAADPASAAQVAARLPATGVTAFLPTLISSGLPGYPGWLRDLERSVRDSRGAQILGAHLEGPYLSPQRAGAHNPDYIRAPDVKEINQWVSSDTVRMVTLAPELPGALDLVRELVRREIVVSAGHSAATYAQAVAGFDAGICWGTHLFNAMSHFAHRDPGLTGALLASDVPCGLIADGVHAHPAAVKIAMRAKGARGLTLVTDAIAAMGMTPGQYRLSDRQVFVDEKSARLADGTLAGSILQMDAAVQNMIAFTGCSLAEAVTMASATPARVLGLAHKGQIAPDWDADLVVLDESLHIEFTLVRGEVVYARK
jgi:N-acetylglucosamine-6-phosphate deacetylase